MAAVVGALRRFPELNGAYLDDRIVSYPHVNLGFAVSLPEGLQVPVIREAETKTVRELSTEAAALAERARQGLLKPDDISGGSFSVSNLGMHDVDSLSSIIMPGQAGILALGTVADRPAVRDGQLVIARLMTATLSCDHRLVDGTTAAAFINECRRFMEHPRELPL
jgi:pyruvate dehydrogenase E2 component (dihydrolipoamide acetyltransferase)